MSDHIAGEDLAAYVDGALEGGPKAELESHLSRCPECLAALAEIVDIQRSAAKIPGEFLRRALKVPVEGALKAVTPRFDAAVPLRTDAVPDEGPEGSRRGSALGEKPSRARAVLPMRLAFGIAAVFLVVVMIGYFFIGREQVETARITEKALPRQATAAEDQQARADAASTGPTRKETVGHDVPVREVQAEGVRGLKMEKKLAVEEAIPANPAAPQPGQAAAPTALPMEETRPQMADEADKPLSLEAEDRVVGGVRGGSAAQSGKDKEDAILRDAPSAKAGARAEEPNKNNEGILRQAAAPARAKEAFAGNMARSRSFFSPAAATGDAMQLFLALTGRAAAPRSLAIPGWADRPAIRIAGDVSRADLSDPGLLDSWSWFPEGLVLELAIAADGSVSSVRPVGQWDRQAAAQADAAARKLLFSASGKKVRRAVLAIPEAPPN